MANLDKQSFELKKQQGIIFSLVSEFRGDDITPINIFNSLNKNRKFIFESKEKEHKNGRYSYMGHEPYLEIMGEDGETIQKLRKEVNGKFDIDSNEFSFKGGAIGYIGYNAVTLYEKSLKFDNKDDLNVPTIRFNFYKRYIAYDHYTNKIHVIDNILNDDCREYEEILKQQQDFIKEIFENRVISYEEEVKEEITFETNMDKEEYVEAVEKAKEHIKAGDIFQVVLSRRVSCKTKKTPIELYRRMREENPSPYMFLIDYDDYQIIGSSPEILVSVKDNVVTTNPIAGTRKRGLTIEEDVRLEKELKNDEKELAEHIMLVDLGRNDVGKISKTATVEVKDFMNIERFSHVMHITSKVCGELLDDKDAFDALGACLPAGTVSGAPKIRAMQIIDNLENISRGIYSGAVGYFSYGKNMEMSIAIRTMIYKDNTAYLQAGAGIVYDSVPELEYEETENKMRILREVISK